MEHRKDCKEVDVTHEEMLDETSKYLAKHAIQEAFDDIGTEDLDKAAKCLANTIIAESEMDAKKEFEHKMKIAEEKKRNEKLIDKEVKGCNYAPKVQENDATREKYVMNLKVWNAANKLMRQTDWMVDRGKPRKHTEGRPIFSRMSMPTVAVTTLILQPCNPRPKSAPASYVSHEMLTVTTEPRGAHVETSLPSFDKSVHVDQEFTVHSKVKLKEPLTEAINVPFSNHVTFSDLVTEVTYTVDSTGATDFEVKAIPLGAHNEAKIAWEDDTNTLETATSKQSKSIVRRLRKFLSRLFSCCEKQTDE